MKRTVGGVPRRVELCTKFFKKVDCCVNPSFLFPRLRRVFVKATFFLFGGG